MSQKFQGESLRPEERRYDIHGVVTDFDGKKVFCANITVWWQRIRERVPLVTGCTSEEGYYHLKYSLPMDVPGNLLIVVEARSEHLKVPLESTPTPAKPDLQIDLESKPRDRSEFATLQHAINPYLDKLSLLDIVESEDHHDISFLANETGKSAGRIMCVVLASRLEAMFSIPAAAFYAFIRQSVPSALPLPSSLIKASQGFTLIDALVCRIGSLISVLTPEIQKRTLETAVKNNIVGLQIGAQIPDIVNRLQEQRTANVLDQPYLAGKTPLNQLLDVAKLDMSKKQAFAQALVKNTQSMRNFWRTLGDGQHGLTETEASAVQRILEIGVFVMNHLPLVKALYQDFTRGTYKSLSDLARLGVQDWVELVNKVGVPPNIDAAGEISTAEVFAHVIYARVTRTYPTIALASRIATGTLIFHSERAPLNQFFLNNPTLDLGKINLATYIEQQDKKAFIGINVNDRPAVIANVKRLQRVLRIAPDVDTAYTLLSLGIHSATQISTMGKQQFFAKAIASGLTKRVANKVYDVCEQRYAEMISLFTQYNRDAIGIWPKAIGSKVDIGKSAADAIQHDPSLAVLFGTQSDCAVDNCTSLLSPAAYLCDLLLWLRNHGLTGQFPTALAALFARRPDIGHLLLNCSNTNTPLPYIDIVNELLEDAISPPLIPVWKQTTGSAAERSAAPEYVNNQAYQTLAKASYPHTLPYNSQLDELRTYLMQSNIALWELQGALMSVHNPLFSPQLSSEAEYFSPIIPISPPPPIFPITIPVSQQVSVAAEYFHIDPHELVLITNANLVPLAVAWNTATPVIDLAQVPAFLQAATITYERLLELLEVLWVYDGGTPTEITGINDICDINSQTLSPLDANRLDKIHRFLRLWRHSRWKMWELDLLLNASLVGNKVLDENALVELFHFRMLQDATGLAVDRQIAFFQDMDISSHRDPDGTRTTSLYEQLFLDPAVPEDNDLKALVTSGVIADPILEHHLPAIQAALQVSSADASTLFSLTNNELTISNLSLIYRIITLAQVVKLSLTDLQRIVPLTTAGSITAVFTTQTTTLAFIQQVKAIQQSGFIVESLIYILTTNVTTTGITQDQITNSVLPAIRATIQQTYNEIYSSIDPKLTILQRELAKLPTFADSTVLAMAISIVNDTYTDTLASRNTFISNYFDLFMDPGTAQTDLSPLPGSLTAEQLQVAIDLRAQNILTPLAIYLTQTRVIAALATNLQLQNDVTALLTQQLMVPGSSVLLVILTDPSLIAKDTNGNYLPINSTNFQNQYLAIQFLDKVGTLVRRLHLVKADTAWLLTNAKVYGGIDLTQLPILNSQTPLKMSQLFMTTLIVELNRTFSASPDTAPIQNLYALIEAVADGTIVNEAAAQTALATISGWMENDIASLAKAIGISFGDGDYTKPEIYDALRKLEAMLSTIDCSGAQLVSFGVFDPSDQVVASALGVLKSRYSYDDWLKVAPTMMNPIRERRSAALQAYLMALRDNTGALVYEDTNALFDYFLIDVQMSSCEVTTRVIQAYTTVQLFVERCLMSLEEPDVVVDLTKDCTWKQWEWMQRYRIWEANREVFLFPENWLIESQRPNRTEVYQKLEQDAHQNENTLDYLETVTLNYIDGLDELAHIIVTGTCTDPITGTIHVVGRMPAEPPRFYYRSFVDRVWTGWQQIHLNIKAHHVVPAIYRQSLCLFWIDVNVLNEPQQNMSQAQPSTNPPSQDVSKYVSIGLNFSIFRNGAWAPAQIAKGKLFDIPLFRDPTNSSNPNRPNIVPASDSRTVEALYTLKVLTQAPTPGYGATLFIDVFRLGCYTVDYTHSGRLDNSYSSITIKCYNPSIGIHIGRAVFDGRFSDLELCNLPYFLMSWLIPPPPGQYIWIDDAGLFQHAVDTYGTDASSLLPLPEAQTDPNLQGEPGLIPQAGALRTLPPDPYADPNAPPQPLSFTTVGALEQNVGPLLNTPSVPFSIVGPDTDLEFDPTSYFFYQDTRRCYFVESVLYYQLGSAWFPVPPSYHPEFEPVEYRYRFHRFYHPYTRLFWHELAGGGFSDLYARNLQLNPDTIDPSGADVFNFQSTYNPVPPYVDWSQGENLSEDPNKEIIDFSREAAFSVYNWELFFHTPLYIAERLSQNQKFEDALKWFHFIFDPTQQGSDPIPQRFWITKPLNSLTTPQILQEGINKLLNLVSQRDPGAVAQINQWRQDPLNPFLLADQRLVAYMKRVVMSYLDNLIAWADNLYSTESREALNEATLLYITAAEILGQQPVAITPPKHADYSFDDLEPKLDAFSNALVNIENILPIESGSGGLHVWAGGGMSAPHTSYSRIWIPPPHTLYFKIPPNDKLLGYWTTVADRLFKLRHCQNIVGVTRQLALFDAPIDPDLLIKAQAAGVDLSSVLNDVTSPLPNYRFSTLYSHALDFVNAVRGYGASLLGTIEKSDSAALFLLQQTTAQQLIQDADQIFEWQVEQAQNAIEVLNQTLVLDNERVNYYSDPSNCMNEYEAAGLQMQTSATDRYNLLEIGQLVASILSLIPNFTAGVNGFGGTPTGHVGEGGSTIGKAAGFAANAIKTKADILERASAIANLYGKYQHISDDLNQKLVETNIDITRTNSQIAGAKLALQIAQQNQVNHQEQIDNLQKQIDFLTTKFTNQDLYDWMVGKLADIYFQSYQLAYSLCKRVERCYRYELGITESSFINFGYWDSLNKGLLAGETLNHDLRRMQASYLEQNSRRFEINRYISLRTLDPKALITLLQSGACDIELLESLFDGDYPGHYQRRIYRVSLTVAYPYKQLFDNVMGTLTLVKNSVRISTDLGSGYRRPQAGNDPRFVDNYGAVPQKIVLSNGQDDPGLFLTAIDENLTDQRYLPFEGAGVISSWHLELPAANNEIDLSGIEDVIIHLYYTALDGGDALKQAVEADNAQHLPRSGMRLFSALKDFPTPWWKFLATPKAGMDQTLVLILYSSCFPNWTRGKTITVTGLIVYAVSWNSGNFVLEPQAPLPNADVTLTPATTIESTDLNVTFGTVAVANTTLGEWTFKLRTAAAADFHSITTSDISDLVLLVSFQVT